MNGPLRNIVWALLLTMAVVVVLGIGFFDVGSQGDLERRTVDNAQVDVASSAWRAQEVAPFPVVTPQAEGEGFTARSARFTTRPEPAWQIQYSSPEGSLVTMVEAEQISAQRRAEAVPGLRETDTPQIQGVPCTVLEGSGEGEGRRALVCQGEGYGVLVHGEAERTTLERLMTTALASVTGKAS